MNNLPTYAWSNGLVRTLIEQIDQFLENEHSNSSNKWRHKCTLIVKQSQTQTSRQVRNLHAEYYICSGNEQMSQTKQIV